MNVNLKELEKVQLECARKVLQRDDFQKVELIGGIDLTFESIKENPTRAWASLVVVRLPDLKVVYQKVVEGVVDFPYIPTFLAFRELPLMLSLYNEAELKPDVFFIDGQGIAHPRGCGIASHFGVETDSVSVGVAKTRLFGYGKEPELKRGSYSYLTYRGSVVGAILRTKDHTEPVYVSVGHRISLKTAIELVLRTSIYRIPEPTRLAHNLLQRVRKELK
ncbi:MAG: endonuclease V [Aquificaceae bacterium]|jgi:deoxyribonuclease V|uniref:endonuclease V n=1 Tax=Hydrogenobacter sp. Uz 6-8 TaxID=3384828 RepID=UPI000F1FD9DB|nr:MAG: endonuclease V [Aquificota bacterium]